MLSDELVKTCASSISQSFFLTEPD